MKKVIKNRKIILYSLLFFVGLIISYHYIEKKKIILHNQEIVNFVMNNSFQSNSIFQQIDSFYTHKNQVFTLLHQDYKEVVSLSSDLLYEPIIYLYNSHPTEEYAISSFGEFSLNPTVLLNNYILEDIFNKNGYSTYIEEKSCHTILEENNWNYASSYKASRMLMEDASAHYPSLKYFIDIHRDSLERDRTTTTIEGRNYAKLLFIIGLENENYENNLSFTEKIVSQLDEDYPGLSKGIYKKEGPGVNGIYNQDFNSYTILVEVGGYQNTTTEVLNSAIAFSKAFMEVIHEENY